MPCQPRGVVMSVGIPPFVIVRHTILCVWSSGLSPLGYSHIAGGGSRTAGLHVTAGEGKTGVFLSRELINTRRLMEGRIVDPFDRKTSRTLKT